MRSGDELSGRLIADPSSVDKERHGAPQYWESHNVALVCWKKKPKTQKILRKSKCCTSLLEKETKGLKNIAKVTTLHCFAGKILGIPDICHGRHGRRPCKFFLAGVNFYRFNAKNWQFTV